MRKFIVFVFIMFSVTPAYAAVYDLTFQGFWNESHVEAENYPSGAHFTSLVGATHVIGGALWVPGELASKAIENVAELGNSALLSSDVNEGIVAGTAGEFISVSGLSQFPRSSSASFNIFADKPEVTLISMIAPSPDWFIGVSGLSLRDEYGWIESLVVDLRPWDAGTEFGTAFDLFNAPTIPPGLIERPSSFSPFIGNPVIGQLHFQLQPVPLPAAFWLFGSAVLGVVGVSRRLAIIGKFR